MELIKFENDGGALMIRVEIGGVVVWRYVYVTEDRKIIRNNKSSPPYDHIVGLPHELDNDAHSWDIQLGNISDDSQDYEVKIIWEQDGNRIHEWQPKKGPLPKGSATVLKGDALLIGINK